MNGYVASALIAAAALLQTSSLPVLLPGRNTPNLVLLLTVSWTLLNGRKEGLLVALGGGIALDLLSGGPTGAATIALLVSSLLSSVRALQAFRGSAWLQGAVVLAATLAHQLVYAIILITTGQPYVLGSGLQVLGPLLVLNLIGIYAVHWGLQSLYERSRLDKVGSQP